MKKFTILLVLLLLSTFQAEAQRLQITNFKNRINDLTARTNSIRDFNGDLCGLIRVQFAGGDMTFEGNVTRVEKITSEYLVWMTPSSRRLTIRVPGYLPVEVDFKEELGLEKGIQSGSTYVMVIEDSQYANKTEPDDKRNRETIVEMIKKISIAYEKKDIAYLEKLFSKNTRIVNGRKIVKKDSTSVVYTRSYNDIYFKQLKRAFTVQDNINLTNEIMSITRHPNNYYSTRVRQHYSNSRYSDGGYLFLVFNFSDELKPTIDVCSWQPIEIPENDLLTMDDIKPYLSASPSMNSQEASNHNNYAQNTTTTTQPKVEPKPKTEPKVEEPKVEMVMVDTDIPVISRVNRNTFAIIIANEDYMDEAKVDFAKNDGEVFKNYCRKTLGLPETNIHYLPNATLAKMFGELDWLRQVCEVYKGEANVIFYYSGHGFPDEKSHEAYIIPVDGNKRLLRTCFNVSELYETLGSMPSKRVTVLMDACFSGAKRSGDMLASAKGIAIKAKAGIPKGNMVVMSAAQGDETAYFHQEAKHGLFTYYLLKKLKETKGSVTLGELSSYIQDEVSKYSIVVNGKIQTPTVQASDKMIGSWQTLNF